MTEQYRFRLTLPEALAVIANADNEPEAAWLWVQEKMEKVNRQWPYWGFLSWVEGEEIVVEVREK